MMRSVFARCCFVLALCAHASATAQEGEDTGPQTMPPDYGFGTNKIARQFEFPDEDRHLARVDRRDDIDATGYRTILMPTAHTPEKLTVSYSNFMLALNQVSFSPTDDLQLSGTFLAPGQLADTQFGLSGKISVSRTDNSELSLQPFGHLRTGNAELRTRDGGVGLAVLFDFIVSDNFVMTAGAFAYGTVFYSYETFTYESCQSRRDFLDGNCREKNARSTTFPSGGHFAGAQLAGTYYILDSLSLRGEVFTGVAAGSVFSTEFLVQRPDVADDRTRFEDGKVAAGIPYNSPLTIGTGLAWSNGRFAGQLSGYVHRGEPERADGSLASSQFLLTPMFNAAVAF